LSFDVGVELHQSWGVGGHSGHFVDKSDGLVDTGNEGVVVGLFLLENGFLTVAVVYGGFLGLSEGGALVEGVGEGELGVVQNLLTSLIPISLGLQGLLGQSHIIRSLS